MQYAKYFVVAGGVIGLLGLFLPSISGTIMQGPVKGEFSLGPVMGVSISLEENGESNETTQAGEALAKSMLAQAEKQVSDAKNGLLVFFSPVVFILLFGLLGLKQFGRGKAIGALIFSLIGLAGWSLLNAAANDAAGGGDDMGSGIGLTFLMLACLLGAIGGLMGAIKPEAKADAAPAATAPAAEGDA